MPAPSVPMLTGWADEIAPGLKGIASGLGSFINPNYDIQKELKARIAADPKILQQLQDAESANPGITAKVFGNQAQTLVDHGNVSYQQQVANAASKAAASGKSLSDFTTDPSLIGTGVTREVTGSNQPGYKTTQDNARILGQAADTADVKGNFDRAELNAKFPQIAAQAAAEQARIDADAQTSRVTAANAARTLEAIPAAKGIDGQSIANKLADGTKLSAKEQQDLNTLNMANPVATKQMIDAAQESSRLSIESGWHHSAETLQNRQIRTEAFKLASDLDMPGHIDAVSAFITSPAAAQRGEEVASGKYKPQTEMDKQLGNIVTGLAQKHDARTAMMKMRVSAGISTALKQLKTASPAERAGLENQINQGLSTLATETGAKPISFQYTDKTFSKDDYGFYTQGANGKPQKIADDEVHKIIFAPTSNQQQFNNVTGSAGNTNTDPLSMWRNITPAQRRQALMTRYGNDPEKLKVAKDNLKQAGIDF